MSIEWMELNFPANREIDPYIYWSVGPGRPYFLGTEKVGDWVIAIVQLLNGTTVQKFWDAYNSRFGTGKYEPSLNISKKYFGDNALNKSTVFFPAAVTVDFFDRLSRDAELSRLARSAVLGPPLAKGAIDPKLVDSEPAPVEPDGAQPDEMVVVGVIDDGIAFGNRRFQLEDQNTRVENAWIQDGVSTGASSTVQYGREFWKNGFNGSKGIDTLLSESRQGGFFDEEKFYRLTGQADFGRDILKTVALRSSHGTHVMDLAAGDDPDKNRTDRPIICVQLPTTVTADTSGSKFDPYVLDAVRYIIDRADQFAKNCNIGPLPIVINFSYGIVAGPHDGTSPLEAELDNIINARRKIAPLEIVLPSGNSHLDRAHAKVQFDGQNDTRRMHWRLAPDDRTSSFMEVWMPYRTPPAAGAPPAPSRMSATLALPANAGESPPLPEIHNTGFLGLINGNPVCVIFYRLHPFPTERGQFFVALLPTAFLDPPTELAPSGLWSVKLINSELECEQPVEAWVQRDDTPYGYPRRGRPSYFDEPCYQRFTAGGFVETQDGADCFVERNGSISAFATGTEPIVIGGIQCQEMQMAPYSAGGPITGARGSAPDSHRPDAAAVSDDSAVFEGVFGAGTRSGSVIAMQGTSVAAPRIARWVADQLAANTGGNRQAVQALAASQEAGYPSSTPPTPQQIRTGAGRIKLDPTYNIKRYD